MSNNKFQIERIALFSDAVFAIAVTLMIIEVKPPHLHQNFNSREVLFELLKMLPTFIGTILSFCLIGLFWMRHHHLFKNVTGYTHGMLWINLLFLLSISFIPFTTTFVFENANVTAVPWTVYNLNYIIATLLCLRLHGYILNPNRALSEPEPSDDSRFIKKEMWFQTGVYVFVIILAFMEFPAPAIGYAAFGLDPVFVRRRKPSKQVNAERQ